MAIPHDYLATSTPEPLQAVSPQVRDGDLLLCSAHDPFSRLIGWATRSPWTHIALAYRWPQLSRVIVFEAVQSIGVRAVPLRKFISQSSTGQHPYPGRIVLARHDQLSQMCATRAEGQERLADFTTGHLGDRFAPGEILKIAVRIMLGRFGLHMPKAMQPDDEFICSEYVAGCFQAIGAQVRWDGLGFIAPCDFADDPGTHAVTEISDAVASLGRQTSERAAADAMATPVPKSITLSAEAGGAGPRFTSATLLPHRAMMLYQLRADVPGLGEIDLMASPPLADGLKRLDGGPDDFAGNASFSMGGAFLLPFVNRIAGRRVPGERAIETKVAGRWVRLPENWGGRRPGAQRYSMHGLMRTQAAGALKLGPVAGGERIEAQLAAGDFGGCWISDTEVTFAMAITPAGFEAQVRAANSGAQDLPMAIGWHPYFRIPSGRRGQARLRIPGRARLRVDNYDDVLPTGEEIAVEGTPYDYALPGGFELGEAYLDDCFTRLERSQGGDVVCELVDPAAGHGVRVIARSPEVIALQVYAPPNRPFVAIEPQTALADPYGAEWKDRSTGMALLKPGEALDYRVRIELFTPERP